MTREQIIELAMQCAVGGLEFDDDGILRFAALVAAHEREQCALVVEGEYWMDEEDPALSIARAIRARGSVPES